MTMRIGHTLFGGAVAGLVIASGVALCAANAKANYKVTRHYESSTTALATSTGYGLKRLFPADQTVNCIATAQGSCVVEFKLLPVEVTATAIANGSSKAYYFTYSFANGDALTAAKAVRIIKPYPHHARALSYAQGEGQTYQLGYAKTAYASANGFGTTYYVGSSNIKAKATITSQPSIEVGAYSDSEAIAEAVVTGQFTIGVAGLATAVADACVDSAVTVNNIRNFTANGTGECVANVVAQTIGVHQAQTGNCYAIIGANPKIQIGGKGKGFAIANGVGDSIGMATGAAAIEGNTSAFAYGNPKYSANAYGQCMASAISTGNSKVTDTRVVPKEGKVTATSTGYGSNIKSFSGAAYSNCLMIGNGKLIQTRVESKFGKAIAVGTGIGTKIKFVGGVARSKCLITAAATKTKSVRSIDTLAISTGELNTIVVGVVPKSAEAVSTLKSKVKRTVSAYSTIVAEATAMGYMQVNDLQEAPESRTYILERSVRLTIVSEELRLVVV